MLLGTLSASLLGNLLVGKRAIATWKRRGTITAGKDTIRASEKTARAGQPGFLMPSHPLTNI